MLFDLRRRGRRRTVQAVYGGLALLMIVGLVGVGVGAGNGNGGILNAFTGGGGAGAQQSAISGQETAARKAVKANPNSAAAWGALLQAQWTSAGQGSNYSPSGFTASGKQKLSEAVTSWTHYTALTSTVDPSLAVLASRAYAGVGNFAGAASAWEAESQVAPSEPKGFECLAVSAYAAGQTRKGDLATTKALSLVPKAQQTTVKPQLTAAKSSAATAKQIAQSC